MIIHLPTGKKFHNRKEAKIYFGTAYYYKMEREKNIQCLPTMFNQQLMNMKIQLKYLQNRTSNIRQDYIRKRYREAINHPLIDFTMRSLYCILPIDRPNFITLSHLFMKVDLNIKVKGYYIKLLHPTNRNAYLVYCWEIVRLMQLAEHSFLM